MKHLIIGGVAGGATAAARLRRLDEKAEIIIVEHGGYISYANCGLPYYIGGTIEERSALLLQTPESFRQHFDIEVRVSQTAVAIDTERKVVSIERADGSRYDESYDKLLLSPGATPVRPPLPGIDSEGIFTLRNVEDTDRIKNYMVQQQPKRAIVVGGGFIGLEMAENLVEAGLSVQLIEAGAQVMAPLDFSMASFAHRELTAHGVQLYLEQGVTAFERTAEGLVATLADGTQLAADMVVLSIGVRPDTTLAQLAGLQLGGRGIKVDEYLETSAPDVFAVGDAIEFPHPISGEPWCNLLAGPANRQGRIVAENMVRGKKLRYEGAIGTAIAKVFDLTVASTGLPAKQLQRLGMPYRSSWTISASHAGYYPGAQSITTKLTFCPETGRIYGAQCVGGEGVDKRIDQIAQLIKHGLTIYDLCETEHAYAPPFSSAKDPIAIAGYVASNMLSGAMPPATWREVAQLDTEKDFLLDVRSRGEVKHGTIEGAVNIPVDELRERLDELPRDRRIVIFCAVGLRGNRALQILKGHGFTQLLNLSGGYILYSIATQAPHIHYPQNRAAQPWRSCIQPE